MATRGVVIVLALMALAAAFVTAGDTDKLYKKYGLMKIYESCLGVEVSNQHLRRIKDAAARCKSMPMPIKEPVLASQVNQPLQPFPGISSLQPFPGASSLQPFAGLSSLSQPTNTRNNPVQLLGTSPIKYGGFDFSTFLEQFRAGSNPGVQYVPVPVFIESSSAIRNKRQVETEEMYFNAERIRSLSEKMHAKLSNYTCIMKDQGYINDKQELQYEKMISEIRSLPLEYELKEDLIEGVDDCRSMVECMPLVQKKLALPVYLKRIMMFKKCSMKMKLAACMKKDLRMKREMFDLSGLGSLMEGADDDDKMLALIWARSNLGEDDYDF